MPKWEFFGYEKTLFQNRIAQALEDVPQEQALFFTPLPPELSSSELVPGQLAARTFDNSGSFADDHVRNFERMRTGRFDPAKARFFNFVMPNKPLARELPKWQRLHDLFEQTGKTLGLQPGADKAELLRALEDGAADIVIVLAHGEHAAIDLSDGTKLTIEEVEKLPPTNREQAPIVLLLSCGTGGVDGDGNASIAQALMLKGRAAAVLAPTRAVSAEQATADLLRDAILSAKAGELERFIRDLRGPWKIFVATPPPSMRAGA